MCTHSILFKMTTGNFDLNQAYNLNIYWVIYKTCINYVLKPVRSWCVIKNVCRAPVAAQNDVLIDESPKSETDL